VLTITHCGYHAYMRPSQETREETAALLAEHGFVITDEGKARAKAKLDEAADRVTPERREELRRVGRDAA
jgi:hypothetical protein